MRGSNTTLTMATGAKTGYWLGKCSFRCKFQAFSPSNLEFLSQSHHLKVHTGVSKGSEVYAVEAVGSAQRHEDRLGVFIQKCSQRVWKTPKDTVVGVLNPGIMERKDEKADQAVLSVDNPQKVMIMGQSKDLGRCRSKKNGDPYTALVYKTARARSKSNQVPRSVWNSNQLRRGGDSMNKVLGKNEVFYAEQSFTAVPAKKNPKQMAKNQHRLMTLSKYF